MPRIQLSPLNTTHASFIIELVNSPGWLEFIGERNVKSREDAEAYIRKIDSNPAIDYWIIELVTSGEPVGIVTLIQRDYLQKLGFLFSEHIEVNGEQLSLYSKKLT